jgi:CHAT domain-containing protein
MKCVAIVVALLALPGCADRSGSERERAFEAARQALWRGDLTQARTIIERGSSLGQPYPASTWPWKLGLLKAEVLITELDLAAAQPLVEKPLPEGHAFDGLRARQRYLEARLQVARGSLQEALASLDRARLLVGKGEEETRLDIEELGGQIQFRLSRWSDGESKVQAVLAQSAAIGDRYRQALALNDLGMARLRRKRCDEALVWFERVLGLSGVGQFTIYAKALNNAGACYARLGQFAKALEVQRRAVDLHEHGSRAAYEEALGELGTTYLLQEDVPEALPYLQRALTIAAQAGQTEDAALWAKNLAAAYVFSGQWDEAERFNNEAKRLNPPGPSSTLAYNTLHEARIAAGRGRRDEALRLFNDALAASSEPRVRWGANDGLAELAVGARQPQRAARYFQAALDTIEKTRSDLLSTDYKLPFLTQLIRSYQAYVDVLVGQGAIERALEVADSSRGRVLAERIGVTAPHRAGAEAFRRMAKQANAVLLSFWLAPRRSYVWIVTADGIRLRELPPARIIEALVRDHRQAIESSTADPLAARDSAGDRLYRLLIEPIRQSIPSLSSAVIVPDGALYGLNFETLPVDGPRRHYWIEDAEIQIAPSLAMLGGGPSQAMPGRSLLLIGNPRPREPEFPALRYASIEMNSIVRHFGPDRVTVYEGDRASPASYRDAHPERFALLHFTAHAAANLESPLDSAVILTGPDNAYKLYARDVAEQSLHATLVTVSACRSAGERAYSGEGLIGFAWAFLRAGARGVIAGLWDVDDRSTAELMDVLYDRLAAGDPAPRALREAKRSIMARGGTAPYYWAPFQLYTLSP